MVRLYTGAGEEVGVMLGELVGVDVAVIVALRVDDGVLDAVPVLDGVPAGVPAAEAVWACPREQS